MNDAPDLQRLRELPAPDVSLPRAMKRHVVAAFEEAQDPSAARRALGLVSRAMVPAFVLGTIGVYMTWAVTAASAMYR